MSENQNTELPVGNVTVAESAPETTERVDASIMTLAELEVHHIEYAMLVLGGNKTKVAKALGISLKTLYNKMHEHNLMEKYAVKKAK